MKRIVITLICASTLCPAMGQGAFDAYKKKKQQEFNSYVSNKQAQLNEYRRKKNQEFAEYLENHKWEPFDKKNAIKQPIEEEVPPIIFNEKDFLLEGQERQVELIPYKKPTFKPQPTPIAPVEENNDIQDYQSFYFYGTPMKARWGDLSSFRLQGCDEKAIAKAYRFLTEKKYDNLLHDCLALRKKYELCDWAYYKMLNSLASTICGKNSNEATFLQGVLYNQSGYAIRFALDRPNNKLHLLIRVNAHLYDYDCVEINNVLWYIFDKSAPQKLHICEKAFEGEQIMQMNIEKLPLLQQKTSQKRTFKSASFNLSVDVAINKNIVDFMNDFPSCFTDDNYLTRWTYYADTPVSEEIKEMVYPRLKTSLENANELLSVNMLLNWVQTGFEYKLDNTVWGHDRAFFAEETMYYPYSDCEDRAILFSHLVRDLLGLDVALVHYPGHLAAAVCFNEDVKGDYLTIEGRKFTICDPTYIRAKAGSTMPQFRNEKGKAILCKKQ